MPLAPPVPEARMPDVPAQQRRTPMTQLRLAREGLLCRRKMPGQDRAHRPGYEPRAKLGTEWGVGSVTVLCHVPVLFSGARGRRPKPDPVPSGPCLPPACPGLWGRSGAGAAAGNLYPGRFCLRRANSQGLKVFHLERQSAFFLSISGQTPMVPGTSLLPNGGAAFSFRLRVILLALLCWNRA